MTVTEAIDNLAAGRASLDDIRADFQARTWRVKPEATSEAEAHRIDDNWQDTDSYFEIIAAAVADGLSSEDRDALMEAYREAPNKLKLTVEQLESGDDPAQGAPAKGGGGGDDEADAGPDGDTSKDDDAAARALLDEGDDAEEAPDDAGDPADEGKGKKPR